MYRYIKLRSKVYFCKGKQNSLIMDCNRLKLYHLDKEATEYLGFLLNGYAINTEYISDEEKLNLIKFLVDKKLIKFTKEYENSQLLPNAYLNHKVKTVWFELRKACNMKCLHCYNESEPFADVLENILTIEQWKNIVIQLQEYKPTTIVLIGGEPLMYREIIELIRFTYEHLPNTQLVLYSNLSLLNDELINILAEYKVKVVTSIYSYKDTIHDSITQVIGSHKKTVENVKNLKKRKIDVRANTVIMRTNQHDIKETKEFINKLTGHNPKSDIVRCVTDDLLHLKPTNIPNAHVISSEKKFSGITQEKLMRAIAGNSCWQGKLNISYDGYISPCIMWENCEETYNLKKYSLKEVLENQLFPNFWSLSKDCIEVCKDCEFRYVCHECRPLSQSLEKRGNICRYDPYKGKWE